MQTVSLQPEGAQWFPDYLDRSAQEALLADLRAVLADAPLYTPTMPGTGKPMRVQMSNCGELGWVTDKEKGYRYQREHPVTGRPWPAMPSFLQKIWDELAGYRLPPQACLINSYDRDARMGMHQDRDEADLEAPVLSLSLGDTCRFRIGGTSRGGKTNSVKLASGDAFLLSGKARLAFHGVDKIYPGTSTVLAGGGRINLTLRRVTRAG